MIRAAHINPSLKFLESLLVVWIPDTWRTACFRAARKTLLILTLALIRTTRVAQGRLTLVWSRAKQHLHWHLPVYNYLWAGEALWRGWTGVRSSLKLVWDTIHGCAFNLTQSPQKHSHNKPPIQQKHQTTEWGNTGVKMNQMCVQGLWRYQVFLLRFIFEAFNM